MSALPDQPSRALLAARCLIGEFQRAGVREALLAPGSRSTPLALALAETPLIRTRVLTDERSLAFFALGVAKAGQAPVLIVCTSGTAAANMLPAVVEASLSGVPLLVLTADRPPELRDCAAPQTIDQVGLYGSHTRWSVDVPILDVAEHAQRYYRSVAMRALEAACPEHAGPVHLNLPFREPFWDASFTGRACDAPPPQVAPPRPAEPPRQPSVVRSPSRLGASQIGALAERLLRAGRGVLVCAGRALPCTDIAQLAAVLQWPILADPLSGLRYGDHDRSRVVDAYDVLLRDERFAREYRPDVVLRFGSTPAPRSLQTFLAESQPCDHLLVATSGWPDPFHTCSTIVRSDESLLCRELAGAIRGTREMPREMSSWTAGWLEASRAARASLDAALDSACEPGVETMEACIPRVVAHALAEAGAGKATLVVGNSMPVRDLDVFCGQSPNRLRVLGNRGASGIDGVLSTALGVAATADGPTALVLGDLSFLHDVTALAVACRLDIPLVTVVINNDGGGIFSYLPQRQLAQQELAPHEGCDDVFETLFGTPHGTDLAATASALLPGGYQLATSASQLAALVRNAIACKQPRVIEIRTDRATNPGRSRSAIAAAQKAAAQAVAQGAASHGAALAAAPDRAVQAAPSHGAAQQAAAPDKAAQRAGR